ncbi:hypothetical protein HNR44_000969 [Geomicrobium halophilum]|uniref:Uncharacterized protein n=1 Tax=Geomicrobium halophilum TaxID=549000 RepID=A0A841PJR3_9BACL|nr:hypothetical protein [Geomicrobium halophilum]MBB6449020.1 hypothetical protein [Geomicrobium halophilum]
MDYLLFFWFAWMLWVVVTFLWQKTVRQVSLAVTILLIVIGAPITLNGDGFEISLAYGFVLFLACVWTGSFRMKRKWSMALSVIALTFLYASFQLMVWYSPVIFLLGDIWVPVIVIAFVTVFIHRHTESRYPLVLLACSFGEVLAAITILPLTGGLYVGDALFYNVLAAAMVLILLWQTLEQATKKWANAYGATRYKRTTGRLSL